MHDMKELFFSFKYTKHMRKHMQSFGLRCCLAFSRVTNVSEECISSVYIPEDRGTVVPVNIVMNSCFHRRLVIS